MTFKILFIFGSNGSFLDFPGSSGGKEPTYNARDPFSILGSGKSPGEGTSYPLQYSWVGVDYARGELFFNVDSDDYLTDDALEKIAEWEATIAGDKRFCGVVGNLGTSPDVTPNKCFVGPYRDASLLERYKEYSDDPIDGEHAYIFYTDIQKKYRYPEFEGERFITPGIPWNRMAHDGYLVRVFNDIIWIYEYLPDGLSMDTGKFMRNPRGHGLCIKEKAVFCGYNPWQMFKFYYSSYCEFREHYDWKQIAEFVDAPKAVMKLCDLLFKMKHTRQK